MNCNEERLIERVRQGDREAQHTLYDTYAPRLLSIAIRYVNRRDVAEDLLHDIFMKVFKSIGRFKYKGAGSLRAWMERITINAALEWLRANKRIEFIELNSESQRHNVADEPSHDETMGIPSDKLMQFISELPDGYRTVFNLFCIEGRSHREIAEVLGINEKSSSSQLLRAKRILSGRIKQYIKENE